MKVNINDDYNDDYYDDADQQINNDYDYQDDLESYWEQIEKEANKANKKHKDKKDRKIERVYSDGSGNSDYS